MLQDFQRIGFIVTSIEGETCIITLEMASKALFFIVNMLK